MGKDALDLEGPPEPKIDPNAAIFNPSRDRMDEVVAGPVRDHEAVPAQAEPQERININKGQSHHHHHHNHQNPNNNDKKARREIEAQLRNGIIPESLGEIKEIGRHTKARPGDRADDASDDSDPDINRFSGVEVDPTRLGERSKGKHQIHTLVAHAKKNEEEIRRRREEGMAKRAHAKSKYGF